VALAQRLIRALCPPNGLVVDWYAGVATTGVAALIEGRRFAGCDISPLYVAMGTDRLEACRVGALKYRPIDIPILEPQANSAVATRPPHFQGPESEIGNAEDI
jgi:adenine-specific DNA-methyltransferase